ncbi:MAG TPA: hypothetical protein VK445_03860 [Dissulfurispiraceae bacterium]|nr:hypothetical protein [Dissulfurispiraceae bacterium]
MNLRVMLFSIVCCYLVSGCAAQRSLDAHGMEWVTRPVAELKQSLASPNSYASKIRWQERTYPLASGNSVFVEPFDDKCLIHWEVAKNGIIIGMLRTEGDCPKETTSTDSPLNVKPTTNW